MTTQQTMTDEELIAVVAKLTDWNEPTRGAMQYLAEHGNQSMILQLAAADLARRLQSRNEALRRADEALWAIDDAANRGGTASDSGKNVVEALDRHRPAIRAARAAIAEARARKET